MKLTNLFLLLFGALFFTSCAPKLNEISSADKNAGWVALFDGKTLDNWHVFDNRPNGWSVKDGAIGLNPIENGADLVSDKAYENYILELEWKISNCGNSGIIYGVKEEGYGAVWHTGPELQVVDNNCEKYKDLIPEHLAGGLYDLIGSSEKTVLPSGSWNKVRLVINNGKVQHWLNGKKVVEFEMFTDKWKAMIANSKFKTKPAFGTFRKGKIALQYHDDAVWYRNIRIKEM